MKFFCYRKPVARKRNYVKNCDQLEQTKNDVFVNAEAALQW